MKDIKDGENNVELIVVERAPSSDNEQPDVTEEPTEANNEENPQKILDDSDGRFNFFPIKPLDFPLTPQRRKELHRFREILKSPFMNVPMLVADRQEDALPLLSLYVREEKRNEREASFFSVTPSDFGMDYETDFSYELQKTLNTGGTIIEEGDSPGSVPVYCDLGDYIDRDLMSKFVSNFLKPNMPAVLLARPRELESIREGIRQDMEISGGLENPVTPYEPKGLARVSELKISPLTDKEKQIYFSYHIQQIAEDNDLKCSQPVCRYFVNQMIKRFSHQDVFFKVFELMNHLVVESKHNPDGEISRSAVSKVLREKAPLHNRTHALIDMDTRLRKKIFGQDEAIDTCYETILSNLDDERREKPTVMAFFGPSGVGKTALAEEISLVLSGKKASVINMAEYADSFKVSILTGSSKGYVDSEEDGLLAKIVTANPRAVIVLDEFEKAHPQVQQMFLGIFDKGSLFDNHSGQIDMSQTTLILTSNAGVRSDKSMGFGGSDNPTYVADKNLIQEEFPPELLGRIDAKIMFNPLSRSALEKVVDKFMNSLRPRLSQLGVRVTLSPEARSELIEKAQDPASGARPLLTLIRQKIKTPIEIDVLKKRIRRGDHIIIDSIDRKERHVATHSTHYAPAPQQHIYQ